MATNLDANINVNSNVSDTTNKFKELKNSLREAIGALAGLQEGTAAYTAQAARVGALRDQVTALNEAVAAVSGSPVENLSNSFGLLSNQVGSLDFEGATASLGGFANQIKNFSFKDLIAGAKSFVSTLGTLGKALVTNPIFIFGVVITAIGAAAFALKDKVKFLAEIFEGLGQVVDKVVQIGKDFLDFCKLSSFAQDELAAKTIANAKATEDALTTRYDREIKLATAAGKDTTKLEILKQKAVQDSVLAQIEQLKKLAAANAVTAEARKKAVEDINALKKQYLDAGIEIRAAQAKADKEAADKKKSADDKAAAEAKAANEKRLADNAKLLKQISDENINAIDDENQRAIVKANDDKARRDQDIRDSKADASIKNQALVASAEQLETDLDNIKKSADAKAKADEEKRKADNDAANAKITADAQQNLLDVANLKAAQNEKDIDAQINVLSVQKDIDIANAGDNADKKLLIEQEYFNKVNQLRTDDAEKNRQLQLQQRSNQLDIASSLTSSLSSLSNLYFNNKSKNLKKGSKEEEENAKKQFKANKALQLASAIIDGAKAVVTSLAAAPLAIGPVPNPAGIASLAAVVLSSATSIAQIASTQFTSTSAGGSGSGGSVGAGASSLPDAVTGSGTISSQFNADTVGQAGTVNGLGNKNGDQNSQRVYVVESDITNVQNKVKTIQSQATVGR